jgi:hypothetical protein
MLCTGQDLSKGLFPSADGPLDSGPSTCLKQWGSSSCSAKSHAHLLRIRYSTVCSCSSLWFGDETICDDANAKMKQIRSVTSSAHPAF